MHQRIGWTPYTFPAPIQHVGVDHGRSHIGVPEQLSNRVNVVAVFKQVRRKRMPQCMTARRFGNPNLTPCPLSWLSASLIREGGDGVVLLWFFPCNG